MNGHIHSPNTSNHLPSADASKEGSIHAGHRDRLRMRYLRSGMEDFAPHEVLELLLTYALPRVNVNSLAHALLDRFGSLSGVLDASREELVEIKGIGASSAVFLEMMTSVFRHYAMDRLKPVTSYNSLIKIGEFLQAKYTAETVEKVYLLLFDNGMHMLECRLISEGTPNMTNVSVRKIVERVIYSHAASVVLAHNHPHGTVTPSRDDIDFTNDIEIALNMLGITLIEHIIVTDHSYAPVVKRRRGYVRATSGMNPYDEAFFRKFYEGYRDIDT